MAWKTRKASEPSPSGFAGLTTTRKPWYPATEYLYVRLPCPSVSTSYSKVQFRRKYYTRRGVV
jgi:hypothetical protein